jgi:ubiquinone/menaquinone biosynthesis C-methylase UbiE
MTTSRVPQKDLQERDSFFTRIYDDMTHGMLVDGEWLRKEYLGPILQAGINSGLVLEVGSGPGYLGLEWLRATQGTHLKCLDINENMLAIARRHAAETGYADRVEYVKGDASRMPFETGYFDALFSNCSLHEWREPLPILNEIHRVLKPGARYCIVDLRRDMNRRIKHFLWEQTKPDDMKPTCLTAIEASYTADEMRAMLAKTPLGSPDIETNFWGLIVTGKKAR